jgi:hypothetical protein
VISGAKSIAAGEQSHDKKIQPTRVPDFLPIFQNPLLRSPDDENSPEDGATILCKGFVRGKQSQIAMQSFGGNHPVKWILVDRWQASRASTTL